MRVALTVGGMALVILVQPVARWSTPLATSDAENTEVSAGSKEIEPPDVFALVTSVRGDIEQIRFTMGRLKNRQSEIGISGAAPREVYYQALTLFRKADRLCFEHTRKRTDDPPRPEHEIQAEDVFQVVFLAAQRLNAVKKKLDIQTASRRAPRQQEKTPTDVFRSIVQANRQLNLLLDQQFAPSDVYQQVTLAISYTSRLLTHFPKARLNEDIPVIEDDEVGDLTKAFNQMRATIQSHEQLLEEGSKELAQIYGSSLMLPHTIFRSRCERFRDISTLARALWRSTQ